ncbi:MAG: hypothetical protein SF162_19410 [bacterium]|nr:hypothetical protein [bacterium]
MQPTRLRRRACAALVLVMICMTGAGTGAHAQDASVSGGDEPALRRLIGRLFSQANALQTQITVGALPPDYASLLPLPPGATILGTLESTDSLGAVVQVYFDAPLAADLLAVYYRDVLRAGWIEPPGGSTSGFIGGGVQELLFCSAAQADTTLRVTLQDDGANTRAALLYQQNVPDPLCSLSASGQPVIFPSQLIPALSPPEGAVVIGAVGGRPGVDQYYSVTNLQTTLSPAAIADHYNVQLLQLWIPTGTTGDDSSPQATSIWALTDALGGQWTAILVVAGNGADVRFVSLQVLKAR